METERSRGSHNRRRENSLEALGQPPKIVIPRKVGESLNLSSTTGGSTRSMLRTLEISPLRSTSHRAWCRQSWWENVWKLQPQSVITARHQRCRLQN